MLFKSSFTSRFKRPFSFQIDIKVHSITQPVVDDELGVVKLLECYPGVVECQSELKLICGSRDIYFLEPFNITDRRGGIWDLEYFYYVIQHQIVLKLLECHHGVVDCQSELKLFCGSREFPF